jgi:hypothetical protein
MKLIITMSFFTIMLLTISCSNKITVEKSNYADKEYGEITAQRVDLKQYKSPNLREGQNSDRLVVMAASGGGSRAASFTIGIMLELERLGVENEVAESNQQRNVLTEIDFLSTVSGGGWGSSAYIAYLYQKNKYSMTLMKYDLTPIKNYETFNLFESHLANWANRRYARYQLPYFLRDAIFRLGRRTSGDLMMDKLNKGYLGWSYRKKVEKTDRTNENKSFDRKAVEPIRLSDVFVLSDSPDLPKLPMLIANTSGHDNFFLIPFTPDRLEYWGVSQYTLTTPRTSSYFPKKPQSGLLLTDLQQIPLAAGIKASSGVPGFISNSFFKSRKDKRDYYLRLQDGGMVDNQGLYTALSIFKQEEVILKKENRVLIIVDASGSGIVTARPKRKNIGRKNSVRSVLNASPDAQYLFRRELIYGLEKECICKVIYLTTEVLLDTTLGIGGSVPDKLKMKKSDARKFFYTTYGHVLKDTGYYSTNATMEDRSFLYEYIRSEIPTWFTSKHSNHSLTRQVKPEDAKGSAKILFLAGRVIVQLQKEKIQAAFEQDKTTAKEESLH